MEATMAYLVEFSNGGKRLYGTKERAYEAGLNYIENTYNKIIDEVPELPMKKMWREEKDKAMGELFKSSVEGDNFECDALVKVTIMEVQ